MQGHEYLNRLTHGSIPTTLIPDARNVWILGDGVEADFTRNTGMEDSGW